MKTAMNVRLDLPIDASHHAHECLVWAVRVDGVNNATEGGKRQFAGSTNTNRVGRKQTLMVPLLQIS